MRFAMKSLYQSSRNVLNKADYARMQIKVSGNPSASGARRRAPRRSTPRSLSLAQVRPGNGLWRAPLSMQSRSGTQLANEPLSRLARSSFIAPAAPHPPMPKP